MLLDHLKTAFLKSVTIGPNRALVYQDNKLSQFSIIVVVKLMVRGLQCVHRPHTLQIWLPRTNSSLPI